MFHGFDMPVIIVSYFGVECLPDCERLVLELRFPVSERGRRVRDAFRTGIQSFGGSGLDGFGRAFGDFVDGRQHPLIVKPQENVLDLSKIKGGREFCFCSRFCIPLPSANRGLSAWIFHFA